MKTFIIIISVFLLSTLSLNGFSQLKVVSTGRVGINIGTSVPVSNLSVNSVGNSNSALWVTGATNGIYAERSGTPGYTWVHSVFGNAPITASLYNIGLKGQSYSTSTTTECGDVIVKNGGNLTINGAIVNLEGDAEFSVEIGGILTFNSGVIQ